MTGFILLKDENESLIMASGLSGDYIGGLS
jgi:hypothetical protein